MTRIDSVRAATGSAKDSVLHAAEVVAPYADTAKDKASHYATEARVRLAARTLSMRVTGSSSSVAYGISTFHPFTDHACRSAARHLRAGIRINNG